MPRIPDDNYQPPPRPDPQMGPAITVNPTTLERRAMYQQLEAECIAHAPHVAASQADYIGRTYGIDAITTGANVGGTMRKVGG